jgi:hypothetical protein
MPFSAVLANSSKSVRKLPQNPRKTIGARDLTESKGDIQGTTLVPFDYTFSIR